MIILYIILFMVGVALSMIIGETITNKFPNLIFSKWWRKNVIEECQDCD